MKFGHCRRWRLNAWKWENSPEDRSEDRPEDLLEDRPEERNEEVLWRTGRSFPNVPLSFVLKVSTVSAFRSSEFRVCIRLSFGVPKSNRTVQLSLKGLSIPEIPFQERIFPVPFAKFNNIVAERVHDNNRSATDPSSKPTPHSPPRQVALLGTR
ncbi:hypothetical protein niasHT_031191 [Heterodera trifolii]|uniref:Uncharacterized protein n=1 Tax=Heterodera trifolii TaxID=157864 RepID=A0ABD2I2E8_9BILA